MISYTYNTLNFNFTFDQNITTSWIIQVIKEEGFLPGDISFTFCNDDQLHKINLRFLNHDTFTDIISFPNSNNKNIISGEIFISADRVMENAREFNAMPSNELLRVMIHGVLHFMGYDDHTDHDKKQMRAKEDYYIHLHPEIL